MTATSASARELEAREEIVSRTQRWVVCHDVHRLTPRLEQGEALDAYAEAVRAAERERLAARFSQWGANVRRADVLAVLNGGRDA